jgi:hypothetical protein
LKPGGAAPSVSEPPNSKSDDFLEHANQFLLQFIKPVYAADLDPLLAEVESTEMRLNTIITEFTARSDWATPFVKKINDGRGQNEPLELQYCVRNAGAENSRCLLILQKLSETFPSKLLAKDPNTGLVVAAPQQVLAFALKAQSIFSEHGAHRDVAFAAGLIFDLLVIWISLNDNPQTRKKLMDLLSQKFVEGIETAQLAIQLGRSSKRLALEKHIISLILLSQASFVPFAILVPDYLEFLKNCKKAEVPTSARNLAEFHKYGGKHHIFSVMLSWLFPIFSNLSSAFLNIDSPHLLSLGGNTNHYDIAAISYLAAYLKLDPVKYKKANRIVAKELRPELDQLDLAVNTESLFKKGGK